MGKKPITRWRAASIHLGMSVLVAALVFAVIYFVWYPGALYDAAGGRELFLLIACVNVAIGPLITLIIYVPGKRGLKFDLATIAVLQVAALAYGTWVLFDSRPVWIVYVTDRYELVRANQVLETERPKAKPPYNGLSVTGPRLVGARLPKDPNEQLRIALSAAVGQDVQTYPQYLVPYDDVKQQVIGHAKSIARLRELNPREGARIDRLVARSGRKELLLGFLPMRAGKTDLTVLVDRRDGEFLGTASLRPWRY